MEVILGVNLAGHLHDMAPVFPQDTQAARDVNRARGIETTVSEKRNKRITKDT
jgi:hypothetical protein